MKPNIKIWKYRNKERKKRLITLFLCYFIIFITLGFAGVSVGEDAPNFRLEKIDGGSVSLIELKAKGNIVVLSFFDTKCKPCIKEIPHFNSLYRRYLKDKYVKIRMIGIDEKKELIKPFIKKYNAIVPVLSDAGGWKAATNYGVVMGGRAEIPQVFVIGKNGKIRKHIKGYREDIEKILTNTIEFLKKEKISVVKEEEVTIIYTNSANGYLESCNCSENPFGGLVRRITVIRNLRKKYPDAISVDTGDNFSVRENKILADYVLKMMSIINYDAVAIGDQELIMGVDFFEKNIKRLPFISANILRCDGIKCWNIAESYKIKEVGGIKVAVLGIIDPGVFILFPKHKIEGLEFREHIEIIESTIKYLRQKADIIILLSHSGDAEDRRIAEVIPGIDLIVGGHSQTFHKEPLKVGNTLIVQTGRNGHRVGKLTLKLDKNKKIKSYENEMTLLIKDIPDDKTGRNLIKEYKNKIKSEAEKVLMKQPH